MAKEFDCYRILKVDYAAYFELWIMLLPWLFCPLVFLQGSKISVLHVATVAAVISLVGLVLLVRRMHFLKYLYLHGGDSIGHISLVDHDGYRKRQSMIEIEHEYQDDNYKILTDLRHSAFYKYHFRKGDNVIIRFDPKNPCEGIIRDAYFSLNNNVNSYITPQLSESVAENKLAYMDNDLLLSEFVFADRWVSDRIDTALSFQQFIDTIMEFGRNKYGLNEKRNRIILRNNFIMDIKNAKFAHKNIFMLEFRRYYHRIYAVYVTIAFLMSFVLLPYFPLLMEGPRGMQFNWILLLMVLLLPIFLIWMICETVRGIKNIKPIDYGKEAERVYFEILAAVREKEKELS